MATVFVIQIQTGEYSDLMTEIDGVYANQELANDRVSEIYEAHCRIYHPTTMKCPGYSRQNWRINECAFVAFSEPFDLIATCDVSRPMKDIVVPEPY